MKKAVIIFTVIMFLIAGYFLYPPLYRRALAPKEAIVVEATENLSKLDRVMSNNLQLLGIKNSLSVDLSSRSNEAYGAYRYEIYEYGELVEDYEMSGYGGEQGRHKHIITLMEEAGNRWYHIDGGGHFTTTKPVAVPMGYEEFRMYMVKNIEERKNLFPGEDVFITGSFYFDEGSYLTNAPLEEFIQETKFALVLKFVYKDPVTKDHQLE